MWIKPLEEDRTHDYSQFFALTDSITTKDKTAIEKTFAGLIKEIYPNGNFDESEAKEILNLAIENRKRIQVQLRKMDETCDEVYFRRFSKSKPTKPRREIFFP